MAGSNSYAIDFGTTNTVITRWNAVTGQPETVFLPNLSQQIGQNPPLIPSLVYVEDADSGKIVAGQAVRDRGLDLATDARFFRNFKRGIGASVQGFMPELDGQDVSFEQVGAWFLDTVLRQLLTQDPEVGAIAFTVPVDSFEAYRYWLGRVCDTLAIEQIRMIDEPTAAALGYGLDATETLLVIDFGGGTLDFSLVRLDGASASQPKSKPLGFLLKWGQQNLAETSTQRPKLARVLAKAGQNLGGADIDNWLIDHFATAQNLPISPITLRLAERLKVQLSTQTEASEVFFNDETFESYELQLDRSAFEQILQQHEFFDRLADSLAQVERQAQRQGLDISDVNAVLLVGGTAQIPSVRAWVEQRFGADKLRADRPFEAIAQGALQLNQGLEVKDFLYHGYGIRYWNRRQNRHDWHPLIPEGQPYPMSAPVELVLGASMPDQPSIELIIGEMGTASSGTEVYFEGDRLVTRTTGGQTQVQPLNDTPQAHSLATLNPLGSPGSDRIKVLFWVDSDRFLRVTVEDLLTLETLLENQAVVQLR
ncbi:Hsp70 family protein [Microcoleus sp. FACHB-1515]|uniref:Hsp70 family protein n=1 Tax=Cyanophyceae TaxID=3028117 RepID=UPI001686AE49|nr:Hsp70 family protein [Microcoleus sp. FACHB-1515]MBD2090008.1 Hsp70 family protein [Microcoleus sp. FACHB-1515]